MKPIILDNVLPTSFVDKLVNTFTDINVDWHYNNNISIPNNQKLELEAYIHNDNNIVETEAFVHRLLANCENEEFLQSNYYEIVYPIFYFLQKKIKLNKVLRARAVLAIKDTQLQSKYNVPHIDFFKPHISIIVYLSDTDGGTILFEDKYIRGVSDTSKKKIEQVIEAKKGRILIFDGLQFHTGQIPSTKNKLILNINIEGEII